MAHHKLELVDFFSPDFELIAIHSKLEGYRLAFFLNQMVSVQLKNAGDPAIQIVKEEAFHFERFIFEDEKSQLFWTLVENKKTKQSTSRFGNLFMDFENVKHSYLVSELKKVDYLLKIEGEVDGELVERVINKTKEVYNVQMAYAVSIKQIKSKDNLIF